MRYRSDNHLCMSIQPSCRHRAHNLNTACEDYHKSHGCVLVFETFSIHPRLRTLSHPVDRHLLGMDPSSNVHSEYEQASPGNYLKIFTCFGIKSTPCTLSWQISNDKVSYRWTWIRAQMIRNLHLTKSTLTNNFTSSAIMTVLNKPMLQRIFCGSFVLVVWLDKLEVWHVYRPSRKLL